MEKGDIMTKKLLSIVLIIFLLFFTLQISVNAASIPLNSVDVTVSDTKIRPGENVKVNIDFGTELGAYTFDIAYDNNIFEYVSSEGGTEDDNGTRVRVVFYDSSGGTNPRTNMSVTFKAKDNITTTNPTDFSVTAEGLSNKDASQDYDDITSPIKKSVTVEPDYKDYTLSLNYAGSVIENKEKEMKLITESSMGKNYDHVILKAEITSKPTDADVKLLATTTVRQEVDLIQTPWGDPTGYALGGKDVKQELNIRGLFTKVGEYTIKISLLDKDSGDAQIATREFKINVIEEGTQNNNPGQGNNSENNENIENGQGQNNESNIQENKPENTPETLPKTGMTKYAYIVIIMAVLGTAYIIIANAKIKKD